MLIECYMLVSILGAGDTVLIKEVKPAFMKLVLRGEGSQLKEMCIL